MKYRTDLVVIKTQENCKTVWAQRIKLALCKYVCLRKSLFFQLCKLAHTLLTEPSKRGDFIIKLSSNSAEECFTPYHYFCKITKEDPIPSGFVEARDK